MQVTSTATQPHVRNALLSYSARILRILELADRVLDAVIWWCSSRIWRQHFD